MNKIIVNCCCGKTKLILKQSYNNWLRRNNANYGEYICQSCKTKSLWSNNKYRDTISQKAKKIHNTKEGKLAASRRAKELWKNNRAKLLASLNITMNTKEYKDKMSSISRKICNTKEYKDKMSSITKTIRSSPEKRDEMSNIMKNLWASDDYRSKMLSIFSSNKYKENHINALANQPRVSSIQSILYSILDDLNIKYYKEYENAQNDKETVIGPYSFDCVIPREDKSWLLIECQGDYWHNLPNRINKDKSKASYIAKNFQNKYELKYLWEHEFKCKDKVAELIKYWLGLTELELLDFDFKEVEIKKAQTKDYRLLLSKYHYLPNAGRGGNAFGAYLGQELVAVCVFSPPIRQNISIDGYKWEELRELSRLCIHPRYQKKNFASWFISRCVKQLPKEYKCIISYCDTTFNHDGAVYKAVGFKQDSTVPPDYWYIDSRGWVMHKKTLYGHARLMKVTESEYANMNGYKKVYGKEKLRFIKERNSI